MECRVEAGQQDPQLTLPGKDSPGRAAGTGHISQESNWPSPLVIITVITIANSNRTRI